MGVTGTGLPMPPLLLHLEMKGGPSPLSVYLSAAAVKIISTGVLKPRKPIGTLSPFPRVGFEALPPAFPFSLTAARHAYAYLPPSAPSPLPTFLSPVRHPASVELMSRREGEKTVSLHGKSSGCTWHYFIAKRPSPPYLAVLLVTN